MTIGKVTVLANGDVEWTVPDLDSPTWNGHDFNCSHDFKFGGVEWQFRLLPNGSAVGYRKRGQICVGLGKMSCGPPVFVKFSIALKDVDGQKKLETLLTEAMEHNRYYFTEQLMSRSEYGRRKSEFCFSGFITVVCRIKLFITVDTNTDEKCFCCKENLDIHENISLREKCLDRPVKCPDCSGIFLLKNWLHGHECQKKGTEGGISASGSSECRHHEKILRDFKQLYINQENCDVALRVKNQEFQAHKAILTARSAVFASTFRNDMKEKETGIVDIEDCDPSVFPDFLCFMYSGKLDNLSEENVFGLFTAADKYDVTDLRIICLQFMKENLSVGTFCDTLTLALQHSESDLILLTTDFFVRNAKNILVTVKWQSFAAENPTQSNELVIKLVASYECSNF